MKKLDWQQPLKISILLMGLGFLLRILWLLFRRHPPDSDERAYIQIIDTLAGAGEFASTPGGPPEVHFGPLQPALAAIVAILGMHAEWAGRFVSLLASGFTVPLIFHLACRLWGIRSAFLAAILTAVHLRLLGYSIRIYPESLSAFLLSAAVFSFFLRNSCGVFCGVFLGLAALTRREAIFLLPFAAAFIAVAPQLPMRSRLVQSGLCLVVFMLLFSPYLYYLKKTTGHWTLSGKAYFAYSLGRAMEEHPERGVTFEELNQMKKEYPTIWSYFRKDFFRSTKALLRVAGFHFWKAFFSPGVWPIGILATAGLVLSFFRRPPVWQISVLIMPFLLCIPWAFAGPFVRYSTALSPFVCLLASAIVALPPSNNPAPEHVSGSQTPQ